MSGITPTISLPESLTHIPTNSPNKLEECSVCKDSFAGEETVLLKCKHYFHSKCGQQW